MQIEAINDFMLELLGHRREEIVGLKTLKELLPVKARVFFEISHWPSLLLNGKVSELAYHLVHSEGTEVPVLVNSEIIKNSEIGLTLYQHLVYPIKRRYVYQQTMLNAKKELERKLAGRDQQLSSIIHELRSPLHGLMNLIDLVNYSNDELERNKLTQAMSFTGRHMAQLVNSLLDWSRLEASGTLELQFKDFNLKKNLKNLTTLFEIQALAKGVKLGTKFSSSLPKNVRGDQNRLNQLLHNLLSNAVKFTDKGMVTLEVANGLESDIILFSVSDTGRGIAPQDVARILQPFGQLNNQPDGAKGSGLGLSITQNILKAFGSELKIESVLGQGTKFSFELSLPLSGEIETEEEKLDYDFARLSVLAADDVAVNRLVLKQHLEKIGVSDFQIFSDGSLVIDALRNSADVHFVLLDLEMPVMNGYETARRIREEWPDLPLFIAALTAHSTQELKDEQAQALFDAFLNKPFAASDLKKLLASLNTSQRQVPPAQKKIASADFSLDQLNNLFEGDEDEKAEFVHVFLVTLDEVGRDLDAASKSQDVMAYASARHKLMSMIYFFGADRVGDVLSKAKSALANGEIDKFNTLERERRQLFTAWAEFVS